MSEDFRKVQRFDNRGYKTKSSPYPDDLVLHADYLRACDEIDRLRERVRWFTEHNQHRFDRDTGQPECECCCSAALDAERDREEIASLRAQLATARRDAAKLVCVNCAKGQPVQRGFLLVDRDIRSNEKWWYHGEREPMVAFCNASGIYDALASQPESEAADGK